MAGAPARLDAVVRAGGDGAVLLHAYDDLGQRIFPHLDPRCLGVPAAALWRRADAAAAGLPALHGAWVRSVAAAFGGVAADEVEALRAAWRGAAPDDVEALHCARLARRMLGLGGDAAFRSRAAAVAHAALDAAALPAACPEPAALRANRLGASAGLGVGRRRPADRPPRLGHPLPGGAGHRRARRGRRARALDGRPGRRRGRRRAGVG
ncbi:MAG: hypothetical protein H6704_20495 [Myxococcales bacterium]|nr:hypothetical protein [Myxococcales bacterium]